MPDKNVDAIYALDSHPSGVNGGPDGAACPVINRPGGGRVEGEAIHDARGAFIVSRQTEDAEQVVRRLDAAYRRLEDSGRLDQLQ